MNRFTVLTKPCWFRYDHFCVSLYRYASINTACLILLWPFHHCTILSSLISENSSSVRLLTAYSHSARERKKVVLGIAFIAKVSSEEMLFFRTFRCSKWISGPVASLRLQIRRPIYPYVIHAFFCHTTVCSLLLACDSQLLLVAPLLPLLQKRNTRSSLWVLAPAVCQVTITCQKSTWPWILCESTSFFHSFQDARQEPSSCYWSCWVPLRKYWERREEKNDYT